MPDTSMTGANGQPQNTDLAPVPVTHNSVNPDCDISPLRPHILWTFQTDKCFITFHVLRPPLLQWISINSICASFDELCRSIIAHQLQLRLIDTVTSRSASALHISCEFHSHAKPSISHLLRLERVSRTAITCMFGVSRVRVLRIKCASHDSATIECSIYDQERDQHLPARISRGHGSITLHT
jgi:hypothetical protein